MMFLLFVVGISIAWIVLAFAVGWKAGRKSLWKELRRDNRLKRFEIPCNDHFTSPSCAWLEDWQNAKMEDSEW